MQLAKIKSKDEREGRQEKRRERENSNGKSRFLRVAAE
jgi:hypothetical protein